MTDADKPASGDGTVYLLHLDPPFKHARHYTGWTSDLDQRLEAHRAGRGARLMEVVKEAGGTFRLARTWPGPRALERAIKNRHEAPKLCPECSPQPRPLAKGRAAAAISRPEAGPTTEPSAAAPRREAASDAFVPEPDPEARLQPWPGRPAAPSVYDDLLPVTDGLISGWRAQLDSASPVPEPEADLELEPLPAGQRTRPHPLPTAKEQPMGIRNSAPETAADPVPPGGWFYDKPLPYSLTPLAEATLALDDPEAEADAQ